MEILIHCAMTSKDAQEIADKLREREMNAKPGESTTAKIWSVDSPEGTSIQVKFYVDQDRARKHGLMH